MYNFVGLLFSFSHSCVFAWEMKLKGILASHCRMYKTVAQNEIKTLNNTEVTQGSIYAQTKTELGYMIN